MYDRNLVVKVTDEQIAKLERLQKRTRRSRAEIVRLLIDSAAMPSRADIRVDERRLHGDDEW